MDGPHSQWMLRCSPGHLRTKKKDERKEHLSTSCFVPLFRAKPGQVVDLVLQLYEIKRNNKKLRRDGLGTTSEVAEW